jgi:hypothetical protein
MKRIIEGYVVNRVWHGVANSASMRNHVWSHVGNHVQYHVGARMSDRVAGLVWNRVSGRVRDRVRGTRVEPRE